MKRQIAFADNKSRLFKSNALESIDTNHDATYMLQC